MKRNLKFWISVIVCLFSIHLINFCLGQSDPQYVGEVINIEGDPNNSKLELEPIIMTANVPIEWEYVDDHRNTDYTTIERTGYFENVHFKSGLYTGNLSNGIPNGSGELKVGNDVIIKGDFTHGKLFSGNVTIRNQGEYSGQLGENFIPNGEGKFNYVDQKSFLTGTFSNGSLKSGYISVRTTDNLKGFDIFQEGEVENHKLIKGKYKDFKNNIEYEGGFSNNKFHGLGNLKVNDKYTCKCNFNNGEPTSGTLTDFFNSGKVSSIKTGILKPTKYGDNIIGINLIKGSHIEYNEDGKVINTKNGTFGGNTGQVFSGTIVDDKEEFKGVIQVNNSLVTKKGTITNKVTNQVYKGSWVSKPNNAGWIKHGDFIYYENGKEKEVIYLDDIKQHPGIRKGSVYFTPSKVAQERLDGLKEKIELSETFKDLVKVSEQTQEIYQFIMNSMPYNKTVKTLVKTKFDIVDFKNYRNITKNWKDFEKQVLREYCYYSVLIDNDNAIFWRNMSYMYK